MIDALLAEIAAAGLVWRVSSPGADATGLRAEAMVRRPGGGQWIFGYGETADAALREVLAKWQREQQA
jgi:hypothetical protein